MFRPLRISPVYISISLFRHHPEYDKDKINQPKIEAPETGWDRVKRMYSRNEYDEPSVELINVAQSTLAGLFVGACAGGFVRSKSAYINFIENNQATIYKSTADAKKKLQDYVTVQFAKGAYQWGWRLGMFTGLFSTLATTMSVYKGDTSLVDFITAGAITGGLYKINLGLAATLVGAGLGAFLSAIAGGLVLGILKLTGVTMDDIRKTMYALKESRDNQMRQALDKSSEVKNDPLIVHHDQVVQEVGEMKIADI